MNTSDRYTIVQRSTVFVRDNLNQEVILSGAISRLPLIAELVELANAGVRIKTWLAEEQAKLQTTPEEQS